MLCGTHGHHHSSLRQKVRQSQQLIISTSKCISRPSHLTVAHLDETPAVDHGETVRATFPTLSSYFGLSTLMPVRMLLINEGERVTMKTSPVCLKQLSAGLLSSHINSKDGLRGSLSGLRTHQGPSFQQSSLYAIINGLYLNLKAHPSYAPS